MKKLISLVAALCLAHPAVHAEIQSGTTVKKHSRAASAKARSTKAADPKSGPLLDEDDKEFDSKGANLTEVNCELGNKVTLYRHTDDKDHMALRWRQRVHQMTRVPTSTGADRFENLKYGLVWIGIPTKGMLLDSKHGQQLANECKDADQSANKGYEATKSANIPPPITAPRVVPK